MKTIIKTFILLVATSAILFSCGNNNSDEHEGHDHEQHDDHNHSGHEH
jgi:hypothetical protein